MFNTIPADAPQLGDTVTITVGRYAGSPAKVVNRNLGWDHEVQLDLLPHGRLVPVGPFRLSSVRTTA